MWVCVCAVNTPINVSVLSYISAACGGCLIVSVSAPFLFSVHCSLYRTPFSRGRRQHRIISTSLALGCIIAPEWLYTRALVKDAASDNTE